jgi:hypothetical protein
MILFCGASPLQGKQQLLAAPVHICIGDEGFAGEVVGDGQRHSCAGGQLHAVIAAQDALPELAHDQAQPRGPTARMKTVLMGIALSVSCVSNKD